jgi:hypothetical protein
MNNKRLSYEFIKIKINNDRRLLDEFSEYLTLKIYGDGKTIATLRRYRENYGKQTDSWRMVKFTASVNS